MSDNQAITVEASINAPVDKVWNMFSSPEHIVKWNNASDDWHTPSATNDLKVGGKFVSTMAAKNGSASFDFSGTYYKVEEHKVIAYELGDGRKVEVVFLEQEGTTKVVETFDPENTHPLDMQRAGWQAILDNFKKYVEAGG